MVNKILKKKKTKKHTSKKKNIINGNTILIIFPISINNKNLKKTFKKKRNYFGGNNTPIDAKECMRQGFCSGEYKSAIPSYLNEYAVTQYSGNNDTNTIGDLHQIKESNVNLSVGDSNYNPSTPPEGAQFVEK